MLGSDLFSNTKNIIEKPLINIFQLKYSDLEIPKNPSRFVSLLTCLFYLLLRLKAIVVCVQ